MPARKYSRREFAHAAAIPALAGIATQVGAPRTQAAAEGGDPDRKDLRQRQLFLDDTWIEESYRLERVWESAEIFPEPVLRPETAWEGRQVVMFGSVFRLGGEWRMYYTTYNPPELPQFCLATSTNGIRWERPKLGLFSFNGAEDNNLLFDPALNIRHDGPTVCYDPQDTRSPFKLMYYASGNGRPRGEYIALSRDGIVWQHHPTPVLTTTGDRTNLFPSRDHTGKFLAILRHRDMMKVHRARTVWRSESEDFIRWTEPRPILRPDLLDEPNTELYGMSAFRYSDLYLGMLEKWYGVPDRFEIQLAWSHNGVDWLRPAKRSAFLGPAFPWNRAWNTCANTAPILVGNQLWFYFGGRSSAHGREHPQSYGAIGLATITIDRFAAMQADFQDGLLITKPMTWPGGDLALNSTYTRYPQGHPAGGGGDVGVEVRDAGNLPLEDWSGAQRAGFNVFSPARNKPDLLPVRWPGGRSLKELAGKRIRLAVFLRDARLYAFRAQL